MLRVAARVLALGRLVNVFGAFESGVADFKAVAGVVPTPEEATGVTLVAGGSRLADLEQDCVGIAVYARFDEFLMVPALLPLAPQFAAAAAVVDGVAGCQSFCPSMFVHPGQHEHLARIGILGNGGQQTVGAT